MHADGVRRLVERLYEQLSDAWDDAAVDDVPAPGFRFRGSLGKVTVRGAGWCEHRGIVRGASPDFHDDLVEFLVDGDGLRHGWRAREATLGLCSASPSSGRRFADQGAAFFVAERGRLSDACVLGDLGELRRQLDPSR